MTIFSSPNLFVKKKLKLPSDIIVMLTGYGRNGVEMKVESSDGLLKERFTCGMYGHTLKHSLLNTMQVYSDVLETKDALSDIIEENLDSWHDSLSRAVSMYGHRSIDGAVEAFPEALKNYRGTLSTEQVPDISYVFRR